jgi:hypothetical protein
MSRIQLSNRQPAANDPPAGELAMADGGNEVVVLAGRGRFNPGFEKPCCNPLRYQVEPNRMEQKI